MKSRYTILLEYNGGTYISQVISCDELMAVSEWLDVIVKQNIFKKNTKRFVRAVQRAMADSSPGPLEGLFSVWCQGLIFADKLALINIVKCEDLIGSESR